MPAFCLLISPIFTEDASHNRVADIIRPLKICELVSESVSVVIGDAIRDILNTALKRLAQRLGVVGVILIQIVYIAVVQIKSLVYDIGLKIRVKTAAEPAKITIGKVILVKKRFGFLKAAPPTGIEKIDGLGVAFVVLGGIIVPLGKPIVDIVGDRVKLGVDIGVVGSGCIAEIGKLAHDGIKEILRRVIIRVEVAASPETEDLGLKIGQAGHESVGLLGGKLPLGSKRVDAGVSIPVDPVVEGLIGCVVSAKHSHDEISFQVVRRACGVRL